jgi:hypothetical protein
MLTAQIVALNSLAPDYDDAELKAESKSWADEYGIAARKDLWHALVRGDMNVRQGHRRSC